MTNMQFPVLASLALLGACSYEVSIGGGGGAQTVFDPSKLIEAVRSRAHVQLGEPSEVRCPPKVQFVPFERYACEAVVAGITYQVDVQHSVFYRVTVRMHDDAAGLEALARTLEDMLATQGESGDVDCRGVVLSRTSPHGACTLDDGRDIDVMMLADGKVRYRLEPKAAAM